MMETLWQRLTQWATQHAPDVAFNAGASAAEQDYYAAPPAAPNKFGSPKSSTS